MAVFSSSELVQVAPGIERNGITNNEMRDLVPERDRPIVDGIINEEESM
jgi:hypothetical protein